MFKILLTKEIIYFLYDHPQLGKMAMKSNTRGLMTSSFQFAKHFS